MPVSENEELLENVKSFTTSEKKIEYYEINNCDDKLM